MCSGKSDSRAPRQSTHGAGAREDPPPQATGGREAPRLPQGRVQHPPPHTALLSKDLLTKSKPVLPHPLPAPLRFLQAASNTQLWPIRLRGVAVGLAAPARRRRPPAAPTLPIWRQTVDAAPGSEPLAAAPARCCAALPATAAAPQGKARSSSSSGARSAWAKDDAGAGSAARGLCPRCPSPPGLRQAASLPASRLASRTLRVLCS